MSTVFYYFSILCIYATVIVMDITPSTERGPVRGQVLLVGEDAEIARAILQFRISQGGQPPVIADILRESLRCYAKELNIQR